MCKYTPSCAGEWEAGPTHRTLALAAGSNANRTPRCACTPPVDDQQYDKGCIVSRCQLMFLVRISVLNRRVWWRGDRQFYKGRITSYKTG